MFTEQKVQVYLDSNDKILFTEMFLNIKGAFYCLYKSR